MDALIGNRYARPCRVLNRKLCLTILTRSTTNRTRQDIAPQHFDIGNLNGLDEEIIESEQCDDGVSASNRSVQADTKSAPFCKSRVDCVV